MKFRKDDIQYAMETTKVLREPDRRIDTFSSTRFEFQMLSPLMDNVNQVRVRTGEVEAQKPQIIKPDFMNEVGAEGFGEDAQRFFDWLKEQEMDMAIFRYGFQFKRGNVQEEIIHDQFENVRDRLVSEADRNGNPMLAIIEGVDDTWEISLLKFTMEMIQKSGDINAFDFKRKGLI